MGLPAIPLGTSFSGIPLSIPPIGFGTYELRGEACVQAVSSALRLGFRLLDTAAVYRNEELVGEGIRQSNVPRSDIFVVVKIAMKTMSSELSIREGIIRSIEKLGLNGYADAVLVHWPGCGGLQPHDAVGHAAARRRCWETMHVMQLEGIIRSIGVANYRGEHFKELGETEWGASSIFGCCSTTLSMSPSTQRDTDVNQSSAFLPVVNQIELHPLCVQSKVVEYSKSHGMVLQQYSPLGKGSSKLLQHPVLLSIQQSHFPSYSIADVLLLWGLEQGFIPIVRSANIQHIKSNWQVAVDYFQSSSLICEGDDPTHSQVPRQARDVGSPSRPPLTAEQRNVLLHLRSLMHVEEDEHLCWNSICIA